MGRQQEDCGRHLWGLMAEDLGCCGSAIWGTDLTPKALRFYLQIITQIWPYLSMIMESKIREKLEPKIREKSAHLRTFTFTKLYFGQKVGTASVRLAWTDWAVFSLSSLPELTLTQVSHLIEDPTGSQRAITLACVSQLVSLSAPPSPPVLLPSFPGSKETKAREQKEALFLEVLEVCTEGARWTQRWTGCNC